MANRDHSFIDKMEPHKLAKHASNNKAHPPYVRDSANYFKPFTYDAFWL